VEVRRAVGAGAGSVVRGVCGKVLLVAFHYNYPPDAGGAVAIETILCEAHCPRPESPVARVYAKARFRFRIGLKIHVHNRTGEGEPLTSAPVRHGPNVCL